LGPPRVAVLFLNLLQLLADDGPAAVFVPQQAADLAGALPLFFRLLADDQDFEPGQAVDFQLEDGVGLLSVQAAALPELGGGVGLPFRLTDDPEDLVKGVEDLLETLQDMEPLLERGEFVLEALGDDVEPEVEEVPEDRVQVEPLGAA